MKFKCPDFYCIPWSYVCDGKWDCPRGIDERNCNSERLCEIMFHCKNSIKCIHLGTICDNVKDCPSGDDEFMCSLNDIVFVLYLVSA